jgi:hypothetical protein
MFIYFSVTNIAISIYHQYKKPSFLILAFVKSSDCGFVVLLRFMFHTDHRTIYLKRKTHKGSSCHTSFTIGFSYFVV